MSPCWLGDAKRFDGGPTAPSGGEADAAEAETLGRSRGGIRAAILGKSDEHREPGVGRLINRLKQLGLIITRCEKRAIAYPAMLHISALMLRLQSSETP